MIRPFAFDTRIVMENLGPALRFLKRKGVAVAEFLRRFRKPLLWGLAVPLLVLEVLGWILASTQTSVPRTAAASKGGKISIASLQQENRRLSQSLQALAPQATYVVVDTAGNRVYLKKGTRTLREMLASCGSGNVLENPADGRRWVFDTPRGDFKVQSKLTHPVWVKPDWAFLEEGEAIPTNPGDRAQPGMMGDYAVGIGKGYFLHGTLYSRLLGRNVSHGCVRLGDDDLEALYRSTAIGSRVIIF